ncbi:unnamed protein product [marine sediment metagenome]|uniref:Uncharacterized protein n=1 Tax=marine sediment metagenome TaxID=412755 RepID=X0UIM3_9ZZZZ
MPEFIIRKGAFTDVKVIHHMTKLGLLSVRKQSVQRSRDIKTISPQVTHSLGAEVEEGLSSQESVLLADVAEFPESGIAERYKRLGISVRQGQKIKDKLIEKKMIQEQVQTISRGKLRVIRLTEQGRMVAENMQNSRSQAA